MFPSSLGGPGWGCAEQSRKRAALHSLSMSQPGLWTLPAPPTAFMAIGSPVSTATQQPLRTSGPREFDARQLRSGTEINELHIRSRDGRPRRLPSAVRGRLAPSVRPGPFLVARPVQPRGRARDAAAPSEAHESTASIGSATRYTSPELGELEVRRQGSSTVFDLGEWHSSVASRKNDDGTISFITIDPGAAGFEFVESKRDGSRALIVREGQHEYIFTEAS